MNMLPLSALLWDLQILYLCSARLSEQSQAHFCFCLLTLSSACGLLCLLVLQQLDGNVIGPKILGNQIGVSGFWIMFSVLVGGGLFGVSGMVLGVPVFAVIYDLLGKNVKTRLKYKVVNHGLESEEKIDVKNDTEENNEE